MKTSGIYDAPEGDPPDRREEQRARGRIIKVTVLDPHSYR